MSRIGKKAIKIPEGVNVDFEGVAIKVKVGSGLSDWDREQTEDTYLHKTIEILYNSVTQNAITEEYSLFLPRFNQVRIDK